ncbi:MAG: AmmeMemoRadiSam system protein B [Pirellulales bacterium]|nr:AmmeMemoRadiSam system protein B [Pirellulales bacterium]
MKHSKLPTRPHLRSIEIEPVGSAAERLCLFWDSSGWGEAVVLPRTEALLAVLMNGKRTLAKIQEAFCRRTGKAVKRRELERVVCRLERARLLASAGFRRYYRREVTNYLRKPLRPAAFAGDAYPDRPDTLRRRLARFFSEREKIPQGDSPIISAQKSGQSPVVEAPPQKNLCGILAPHIDPVRGGRIYAAAYQPLRRADPADLFVIFGTAHAPLGEWFSATRKDFDTPLGAVRTDQAFCDRLQKYLSATVLGRKLKVFADELAHRREHSLEFQAVFLQYLFGRKRPFRIVPILVGSFQHLIDEGETPEDAVEVHAFVQALRAALAEHPGRACCISSADLAHIGPHFGDPRPVDEKRLRRQATDDRKLLRQLRRGDRRGFYRHVARCGNRDRICGLAPTYLMLQVLGPVQGQLLDYAQNAEPDGSACVTYAAAAFYR